MKTELAAMACAFIFLAGSTGLSQPINLALGKPYTFSRAPSYSLCTDPGDISQLTDGERAQGRLWSSKEAVGWSKALPVIVTIDLGRREPIRGASWSTAGGVADVQWPQNILVLASDDKLTWSYLGDLCSLGPEVEEPPAYGSYARFTFSRENMRGSGRYVALIAAIYPYCFADEIEVWRGEEAWLEEAFEGPTVSDLDVFFRNYRVGDGVALRVRRDLEAIVDQAAEVGGAELRDEVAALAAGLAMRVDAYSAGVDPMISAILPYPGLHEEALALNSMVLQAAGMDSLGLWTGGRWDPIALYELPPEKTKDDRLSLELMRREVRGAVLNITHPGDSALRLSVELRGLPSDLRAELREVLFTDTSRLLEKNMDKVAGNGAVASALRLMEPEAGRLWLTIPAGCTKQLWLSVKRPESVAGLYEGVIALRDESEGVVGEMEVRVRVRDASFPERPALHLGGWDYMQGKANYHGTPENLVAQQKLMRDHYVDSPWATSAVFPKGARFDESGALLNAGELDFALWDEWVERWSGAGNYCVFFSVGGKFHGENMGTPRFDLMVGDWLRAWVAHMRGQGLEPERLVALLVDEPSNAAKDEIIIHWGRAIKAADTGIVIFEDPTHSDPYAVDPEMFAVSDILCPKNHMTLDSADFADFYLDQRARGKTLWLYSCNGPAKLLDPIAYHRSQMWQAFRMGAVGSMYWALGSGGGIGDSWRAHRQTGIEYSPYFVSATDVMESKHSEALREGVQDYEYLCMLRDKLEQFERQGRNAEWRAAAGRLLTSGVDEALRGIDNSVMNWAVAKDRDVMDRVRLQALDLLERANVNGRMSVK